MLCYLDSDDAENSVHLFTVVTLVCELHSRVMHGYGGRADILMFFGPCASCVLSPMLGFRRCVKS